MSAGRRGGRGRGRGGRAGERGRAGRGRGGGRTERGARRGAVDRVHHLISSSIPCPTSPPPPPPRPPPPPCLSARSRGARLDLCLRLSSAASLGTGCPPRRSVSTRAAAAASSERAHRYASADGSRRRRPTPLRASGCRRRGRRPGWPRGARGRCVVFEPGRPEPRRRRWSSRTRSSGGGGRGARGRRGGGRPGGRPRLVGGVVGAGACGKTAPPRPSPARRASVEQLARLRRRAARRRAEELAGDLVRRGRRRAARRQLPQGDRRGGARARRVEARAAPWRSGTPPRARPPSTCPTAAAAAASARRARRPSPGRAEHELLLLLPVGLVLLPERVVELLDRQPPRLLDRVDDDPVLLAVEEVLHLGLPVRAVVRRRLGRRLVGDELQPRRVEVVGVDVVRRQEALRRHVDRRLRRRTRALQPRRLPPDLLERPRDVRPLGVAAGADFRREGGGVQCRHFGANMKRARAVTGRSWQRDSDGKRAARWRISPALLEVGRRRGPSRVTSSP